MHISEFDTAPHEDATALLRPCLDVPRWIDEIVDGRPYGSVAALLERARSAAEPLTAAEVARALAHHPRIGDRTTGDTPEEQMSRAEQGAGATVDEETVRALRAGNSAYEERFDRVFLIRAAGRSASEILAALRTRLESSPEDEARTVAEQLREIAVLRLGGRLSGRLS